MTMDVDHSTVLDSAVIDSPVMGKIAPTALSGGVKTLILKKTSLPYSVDEIYSIRNYGKYGTLKRTYNEFYHLYQLTDYHQMVKPEKIITEDSKDAGYVFEIYEKTAESCISAGKSFG